jgi:hypothetical protein
MELRIELFKAALANHRHGKHAGTFKGCADPVCGTAQEALTLSAPDIYRDLVSA